MSDDRCASVRAAIPDLVGGRLTDADRLRAEEHVAACEECGAELEIARLLYETRPEIPAGLAARVRDAVRDDRRGVRHPWWALSAAAIAALALGIGIVADSGSELDLEVPGYAYEVDDGELWPSDDGLIAGAPALEELSDEQLGQLLDELTVGSSGGAA